MPAISNNPPTETNDLTPHHPLLPWVYWGFAAFFFFSEYFVRVSTSVMANDLMRELHVGALALGSLSAAFYYAYLGMQIPVGALVDRFGPRLLLTLSTALCAIGSFYFSSIDSLWAGSVARFILGFGSAFAFVGALKLAATWLPARFLGVVIGITQALGMLGASVGEVPMSLTVAHFGWRQTMVYIGILFVVLSILICLIVRNNLNNGQAKPTEKVKIIPSLKLVLSNKQTWYNALYCGLVFAPIAAFGELWGVNFLTGTHGLTLHKAASCISMIFIGWTFGGPLFGWFSDRIQKRRPPMLISALLGLALLPMILFMDHLPFAGLLGLFFVFGLSNAGLVAGYALAAEINPPAVSGICLGFTNMASVIIGACLQPVIGAILDLHWTGKLIDGVPFYTPEAYLHAMMILPVTLLLAAGCVFFIKETHCKAHV